MHFTDEMIRRFRDDGDGGYLLADRFTEQMIASRKDYYDTAVPSGNSIVAMNLLRLSGLTGRETYRDLADELIAVMAGVARRHPTAHTMYLAVLNGYLGPSTQVVVVGRRDDPETVRMRRAAGRLSTPGTVLIYKDVGDDTGLLEAVAPFTGPMGMQDGRATMYVCRNRACAAPLTDPGAAEAALRDMTSSA
jgi:uncharacterized protein YyaL (SSP411 family)